MAKAFTRPDAPFQTGSRFQHGSLHPSLQCRCQTSRALAALSAASSTLGRRISETISVGKLDEISIQADEGALFVYAAGSKAVLAVLGPQGGNAGLIHLEARAAAKGIGDLF